MNHTTNYNLPQWEDADRILREDMNAALKKTDATMAENERLVRLALHMVGQPVIIYKSLSAPASSWQLDITSIDFNDWKKIYVQFDLRGSGTWKLSVGSYTFSDSISLDRQALLVMTPFRLPALPINGVLYEKRGRPRFFVCSN